MTARKPGGSPAQTVRVVVDCVTGVEPVVQVDGSPAQGQPAAPPAPDGDGRQEPLLVTVEEAARLLSVSRSTVFELMDRRSLPSLKIGRSRRIRMADLERFVSADAGGAGQRNGGGRK
jgi:excisionase family DNA binding protein